MSDEANDIVSRVRVSPDELHVRNIMEVIKPVLSGGARQVYLNERMIATNNMFSFGVTRYDGTPHENRESYLDFGKRIDYVISQFDGRERPCQTMRKDAYGKVSLLDITCRASIEACLGTPIMIPLVDQRYILVTFLFIYDIADDMGPKWLRNWVNSIVGDVLMAQEEGAIPVNPETPHPDFPTLPIWFGPKPKFKSYK